MTKKRPGSRLAQYFGAMLDAAPEDCLCRDRAHLMDVMGPRWCNDNLEYLVDWIEEEADERGLFEDDELQKRMEKYLRRSSRTMRIWFAWAPASLQHRMRESNWARRVAIRRLLITFIRRSCRHSTPPEITSHHAINVPNTTS